MSKFFYKGFDYDNAIGGSAPIERMTVKECIRLKGLKQRFVAQELGVTESYLSRMINGSAPMSEYWISRIAEVCSIERHLVERRPM